jgi:hypothetical protein
MAIPSATAFSTPLGEVPVDAEAFEIARGVPEVRVFDAPFDDEHSLEVQLPFLQVVLEDFRVLPVLVGQAAPESVAALIDALCAGDPNLEAGGFVTHPQASRYFRHGAGAVFHHACLVKHAQAVVQYPLTGTLHTR